MVLGYLLLGWAVGFAMALAHLMLQGGSWLGAIAVFYAGATLVIIINVTYVMLRSAQGARIARAEGGTGAIGYAHPTAHSVTRSAPPLRQ